MYSSMAATNSVTLVNTPRRSRSVVMSRVDDRPNGATDVRLNGAT
jgi:hypothetical protein